MPNGNKPLYQPWSEEEFCGDMYVQTMKPLQRWMYRTLLQKSFVCATRPYLPDDDNLLWALAGCESREQWEDNKKEIRSMFKKKGKLLVQNRVEMDYTNWEVIIEKRRNAANTRWNAHAQQEQSKPMQGSEVKEVKISKEKEGEENMSLQKRMVELAGKKLRWLGTVYPTETAKIKALASIYGSDAVLEDFERALGGMAGGVVENPISFYLKTAQVSLSVSGEISASHDDRIDPLCAKVYGICGKSPAGKDRVAAEKLLTNYSPDVILEAFTEYYGNCTDEFAQKRAVNEFFGGQGGIGVILAVQDRKSRESKNAAIVSEQRELLSKKSTELVEELLREEAEDAEMLEDTRRMAEGL